MASDISILISAKDNFSPAINSMRNSLNAFDKDAEETATAIAALEKKQESLRGSQAKLQTTLDGLSKSIREAKKNYKGLDDAAGTERLEKLHEQYLETKDAIKQFGDEARRTQKEVVSLSDAQSRSENRAGGLAQGGKSGDVMKKLATAGVGKLFTDAIAGFADARISSMFGVPDGNAFASVLSGGATGAVMGSIAGPPGAVIGAGVGLASGGINAATQTFKAKDDAFKGVVQEQLQGQQARQAADLTAGSGIAAGRETSLISFSTLFGDKAQAESYLEEMKDMANTTPFLYDDLAQMSKVLKTYGYSAGDMLGDGGLITKIGDTGAAMGMGTADMSAVATSLGRMNSSGKTSLEYLNPLIERGIPAIDYLAAESGKTKEQIYDMVSKGLIPGGDAAEIIVNHMGAANKGAMEMQSKTFSGLQSTLQGMNEEMQSAMGEGYNEARKKGIENQIDYLSGESGEQAQETNRLIGAWKGEQENQKEEMLRTAESGAYERIAREGLAGAEAGKVLAEARVKAEADYMSSDGAKMEADMQKSLVQSVRQIMLDDNVYQLFGYDMGVEYSKGMASAIEKKALEALDPETFLPKADGIQFAGADGSPADMLGRFPGHAAGLRYVPRDNYLARLHEGEQVLTAQEARNRKPGGVTVTGNNFTVREEDDIYKIAQELFEQIRRAKMVS